MALPVTVENFIRAESDRMFASLQTEAGGVNCLKHNRAPTPIEHQPVIRMNRDTLYSSAIVDISQGATVTLPDGGGRYVSVMVVNQDHFINRILHEPGEHRLPVEEFDPPWSVSPRGFSWIPQTRTTSRLCTRSRTSSPLTRTQRARSKSQTTTPPAGTRPARLCSNSPKTSGASTTRSVPSAMSIRFAT